MERLPGYLLLDLRPANRVHAHAHAHAIFISTTGLVLLKTDCGKEVRDHWPVARGTHKIQDDAGGDPGALRGGRTAFLGWRRRVGLPGILRNHIRDPATTPLRGGVPWASTFCM